MTIEAKLNATIEGYNHLQSAIRHLNEDVPSTPAVKEAIAWLTTLCAKVVREGFTLASQEVR